MSGFPNIQEILLSLPPLLIALSFHEFAHAFTADRMGDPTARHLGRLTINPLKHLDPLGTLLLIFYQFGWAKPVPINPNHFGYKRLGMFIVSLAGPGSNFLLAVITAIIYQITPSTNPILNFMIWEFISINIILAAFNLIPLPPLDGSKILFSLLPRRYTFQMSWLETYGPVILMLLAFTNFLGHILYPIRDFLIQTLVFLLRLIF